MPNLATSLTRSALGALLFSCGLVAQANPVIAPTEQVAGRSQIEWAQSWWQWALSFPADQSPLVDDSGALNHIRNDGSVVFLTSSSGGSATNAYSVPANRPLFLPLVTTLAIELPSSVPGCLDEPSPISCTLSGLALSTDVLVNPYLRIDGIDYAVGTTFRQTSTTYFDMLLPDNSLVGLDAGLYPNSLATDGYWVMLSGLALGPHTLEFGGGDGSGFYAEVRSEINAVPAPETLGLILFGVAFLHAKRTQKSLLALFTGFALSACGGGGGETSQPTVQTPLANSNPIVMLKVATQLIEWTPYGNQYNLKRGPFFDEWSIASGTETGICFNGVTVNPDGVPSVGDSLSFTYENCTVPNLSGGTLNWSNKQLLEITQWTQPSSLITSAWSFARKSTGTSSGTLRNVLVAGKYDFSGNYSSKFNTSMTYKHETDDSQIETFIGDFNGTDQLTSGNNSFTFKVNFSCRFEAAKSTAPDCSDTRGTAVGNYYGANVNAVLTQISKSPVVLQIVDGATKYSVEVVTLAATQRESKFKLTGPNGEVIEFTGEDVSWLSD
jgi:hypothetical protein